MATVQKTVWKDILGHVRLNHPELSRGWFNQLSPGGLQGGILQVRARNHAQVKYLDQHCQRAFAESAQAATNRLVSIDFGTDAPVDADRPKLSFELDDGQLTLNADNVFENFVTGPCNRLAHAASLAVAQTPGKAYNPMFIHGATGLGKTHLLQAICHAVMPRLGNLQVMYISCETFINHFLEAVECGALNQFRYRYRHAGVLVIDDIQFLAERERSQEEFFHTFNTLHQSQRQIVLSADCTPGQIPSLEDRLISRFNSGLVALVDRPCLETRMAIVRKKAKLRCIEVPEEVVSLITEQVDSNIRELEGALIKLDALSQTADGKITLDLAYQALGSASTPDVSVPEIIEAVTGQFSVKRSELLSKKRSKSVAFPRQVCMYLARKLTGLSLEEIGGYFGGRDHTTVLHALKRIDKQQDSDATLKFTLEELSGKLRRQPRRVE
ncbi:MAG: chromosomal replication initiator protein DnaA [Phycisphaerae bacterium]